MSRLRRMFGKTGVFCDGLMLAMVRDDALYFRVDDDNRALFKEAEAFPPLNYEKGGGSIDLAFWRAPERLFDEPDEFLAWARAALGAARRVAAKRDGVDEAPIKVADEVSGVRNDSLLLGKLTSSASRRDQLARR